MAFGRRRGARGDAPSATAPRVRRVRRSPPKPRRRRPLPLTEFEPKSMLHVAETTVQRARFPVIDFHTHVSRRRAAKPPVPPAELVKTMDAVNLRTMVNLTGGFGEDLSATIATFDRAFPRRFVSMTEPAWTRASEPGYAAVAGRRDREGQDGRRGWRQGAEDAGPLSARRRPHGQAREGGRPALRSDVGGLRAAGAAGGDPRRRPRSVLSADRSLQRTVRGAQRASGLVLPWQGLPVVQRDSRRA